MAQRNGAAGRRGSGGRGNAPRGGRHAAGRDGAKKAGAPKRAASKPAPLPSTPEARVFRLGVIPGAMPGRWADRWQERMTHATLELVPIEVAAQRRALDDRLVDAAIVRRPLDETGLHVVALYDEVPVVVVASESDLTVVEELQPADLEGSVVITPLDDVLGALDLAGTTAARFDPPETTADAIATVATGVGVAIVPLSLARLHHRRDVTYRPLVDGPVSSVAFAWPQDGDSDDVQAFVGIIRGRTANSSR
ncbi:LysR substrate-binding domain-containing protein [Microbacterium betulae]|uniref:LysR substrate-binding domain-containing protein n=1 Tax=Microbacterium betulae TaxID=2981139 RepID=A0AA97I5U6_9MICO|nr:LysR substrate-binding domain-containing protein [Microbacterium sp. AB]WOF22452.1 LysR substrate-binding domain-containing protein [Microbacterium sp. AB]